MIFVSQVITYLFITNSSNKINRLSLNGLDCRNTKCKIGAMYNWALKSGWVERREFKINQQRCFKRNPITKYSENYVISRPAPITEYKEITDVQDL